MPPVRARETFSCPDPAGVSPYIIVNRGDIYDSDDPVVTGREALFADPSELAAEDYRSDVIANAESFDPVTRPSDGRTVAEMKVALDAAGVDYPSKAKRDDLAALYDEAVS